MAVLRSLSVCGDNVNNQQIANATLSFGPVGRELFVDASEVQLVVTSQQPRRGSGAACQTYRLSLDGTVFPGGSQLSTSGAATLRMVSIDDANAVANAPTTAPVRLTYDVAGFLPPTTTAPCSDLNLFDCVEMSMRFTGRLPATLTYAGIATDLSRLRPLAASHAWRVAPLATTFRSDVAPQSGALLAEPASVAWRTSENSSWPLTMPPFTSPNASYPDNPIFGGTEYVYWPVRLMTRAVTVPRCSNASFEVMFIGSANVYFNGKLVFCAGHAKCSESSAAATLLDAPKTRVNLTSDDQRPIFVRAVKVFLDASLMRADGRQMLAAAFVVPSDKSSWHGAANDSLVVPFTLAFAVESPSCAAPNNLTLQADRQPWSAIVEPYAHDYSDWEGNGYTSYSSSMGRLSGNASFLIDNSTGSVMRLNAFPWGGGNSTQQRFLQGSGGYSAVLLRTMLNRLRVPDCDGFRVVMRADMFAALWIGGVPIYCGPKSALTCTADDAPQRVTSASSSYSALVDRVVVLRSPQAPPLLAVMLDGNALVRGAMQLELSFLDAEQQRRCSGTCSDGILNGLETAVDCGGSCRLCPLPSVPGTAATCASFSCAQCLANSAAVDCRFCGDSNRCEPADSSSCVAVSQCPTGAVDSVVPTTLNGNETAAVVDPGGSDSTGLIVGVVLAIVIPIAIVLLVAFSVSRRRRQQQQQQQQPSLGSTTAGASQAYPNHEQFVSARESFRGSESFRAGSGSYVSAPELFSAPVGGAVQPPITSSYVSTNTLDFGASTHNTVTAYQPVGAATGELRRTVSVYGDVPSHNLQRAGVGGAAVDGAPSGVVGVYAPMAQPEHYTPMAMGAAPAHQAYDSRGF